MGMNAITPPGAEIGTGTGTGEVELGLYGRRIEARTLVELAEVLRRWGERTRQAPQERRDQDGEMELQDTE